jgi:hypothetical protein
LIFATRVGVGKVAITAIDLAINRPLAAFIIQTPPVAARQGRQ